MADRRRPVPVELVGQARLLRERLARDFDQAVAAIGQAVAPVSETARSKAPSRWLVHEAARRWNAASTGPGRLSPCELSQEGRTWFLREYRASPGDVQFLGLWDSFEPGFLVMKVQAELSKGRSGLGWGPAAHLSVHAVARRAQRGGGTVESALADITGVGAWARLHVVYKARQPTTPVLVPTARGHWRGTWVQVDDAGHSPCVFPALRTWLDDDAMGDAFCADLAELRRLGPEHVQAKSLLARMLDGSR